MNKYLEKIASYAKEVPDASYTSQALGGAVLGHAAGGLAGGLGAYGYHTLRNNAIIAKNVDKILDPTTGISYASNPSNLKVELVNRHAAARRVGGATGLIGGALGLHYALKKNKEHILSLNEKKAAVEALVSAGFDFDTALMAVNTIEN